MNSTRWTLLLALAASASTASAALTHQYSFNGDANDTIGGANGSLVGGATVSGGALVLGGNGQYADLPAGAISLNTYSGATLELWLTSAPANTSYTMAAVFGRSFTGASDPLSTDNGGPFAAGDTWRGVEYLMVQPTRGGGPAASRVAITDLSFEAERGINGPSQINDDLEHYIAVTVGATDISYYLDGALVGSTPLDGTSLADVSNTAAYLGRSPYPDPYFVGSINEFRIWNEARSASDIALQFAAGANVVVPEPSAFALLGLGLVSLAAARRRA